jgi:hypothetical protein
MAKTAGPWPPTRSALASLPPQYITHPGCQLSFDCCMYLQNGSHQRPTPPLYLYFLMWLQNLSQTREPAVACIDPVLDACNKPIGSNSVMIWGRHCPIYGERAKLRWIGRWRLLMLIVVCCVHVCGCVLCVGATLAAIPVESQHQPSEIGHFCTLISQNWPTNRPNMTRCANSSSYRDVAHRVA